MDKRLIIIVHGGLCNRLKPILSGMRIAKAMNRKLSVCWQPVLHTQPSDETVILQWPGTWNDLFSHSLDIITDIAPLISSDLEWQSDIRQKTNNVYNTIWDYNVVDRHDVRDIIIRSSWRFLRFADEPNLDEVV